MTSQKIDILPPELIRREYITLQKRLSQDSNLEPLALQLRSSFFINENFSSIKLSTTILSEFYTRNFIWRLTILLFKIFFSSVAWKLNQCFDRYGNDLWFNWYLNDWWYRLILLPVVIRVNWKRVFIWKMIFW